MTLKGGKQLTLILKSKTVPKLIITTYMYNLFRQSFEKL